MRSLPGFQLDGRIALVTGAGRGLGVGMASGLAKAEAEVILVAPPPGRDQRGRIRRQLVSPVRAHSTADRYFAVKCALITTSSSMLADQLDETGAFATNTGLLEGLLMADCSPKHRSN